MSSCAIYKPLPPLLPAEAALVKELGLEPAQLQRLKAKPLFEFTEQEVDLYLHFLHNWEPDLHRRVIHLGRKNLGQPYQIFLLGEFPFELYDPDPMYCLTKSDCLVFSEHTYAMGLAWNWQSFFSLLQRIRYNNGQVSSLTRNHYTIPDWDQNNAWLLRDVTEELAPGLTRPLTVATNRKGFFARSGITYDGRETTITTSYIPAEEMEKVIPRLQNADFVNVIYGFDQPGWCGHTGLISIRDDSTVNFLHSTPPRVREQPILEYANARLASNPERRQKKKSLFYGFKFLRLRGDALEQLRRLDGTDAPRLFPPPLHP